jgi:signal transduction histidine kinase
MTVPETPIWVPLGAVQLEQVILNLAVNACQAISGVGNVHVIADVAPDGTNPGFRLRVIDTGEGIAPDVLPHIFEPYFSTKRSTGTGLGLAIVHGMIKAAGGDVRVNSTPGTGSTFTVLLPRLAGPEAP